jgi:hypothetical protein
VTEAVRQAFRDQARACAALGSPLTARVLAILAEDLGGGAVAARVLGWPGNPSSSADAVALRLAGGLHALVLSGQAPGLAEAYAEGGEGVLQGELAQALAAHEAHLLRWLDSPPQTNEVRRSTVLIAAGHWLADRFGLPMVLSELGASAGLNLLWDRYALAVGPGYGPLDAPVRLTPDWQGALPPLCPPAVVARAGVDLNPLDPVADRLRLLAYVWADQPDRLARTRAAADVAAGFPGMVAQGDAVDWLAARLAAPLPGHLHLIFHTVAWQYFPAAAQTRGEALLAEAGASATPDAPLARLAMEADGGEGAAVTLTLWPGGEVIPLARADFHGRWVRWEKDLTREEYNGLRQ